MLKYDQAVLSNTQTDESAWPVFICLLGHFRLLQAGNPLTIRSGGKTELILAQLGLSYKNSVSRNTLTNLIWPMSEATLANQSLNSLVYSLHKLIGDALGGAPLILHEEGMYRLNSDAGVGVDVACFDAFTQVADQQMRAGEHTAALAYYQQSLHLYGGDLCITADVHTIIERERLRARYLTLLGHLAAYYYYAANYSECAEYAWRLLRCDPSREDAHRMVMRCYVHQGERAAALRHYYICQDILRAEFDTTPEPATIALFEQIRLQPNTI